MPNLRYHSVATVPKLSLGSPTTRAGGSRRSLLVGMNRAKTRRTWKPTESAQVWSSSSSRSRANTLLNEIRTSLPKRSTQPCSIVQSRCASVPSDWKSRSRLGSIHPVFILFLGSYGIVRNQHGATDGLPLVPPLLQSAVATGLWPVFLLAGFVGKRPAGPWLQDT